jgi:Putative Actinobacterial Holin-X, holin superfamily III
LIVGGVVAILAAIFFVIGQKKVKLGSLRPDKTIQSLQENVTWLKKQTE